MASGQGLTLVVMAAGLGRRFGGPKQIEPVGPSGEILLEYSVYDALTAGFDRVVFIVSGQTEAPLREIVQARLRGVCKVDYIQQKLSPLPPDVHLPAPRTKPWGTAHAVLSCAHQIESRFAVINADDFYGRDAFLQLGAYLNRLEMQPVTLEIGMVGYPLENTLTEHGAVARGVCVVDADGYLVEIRERTKIERRAEGVGYRDSHDRWNPIPPGSLASMNMWGFPPHIFQHLEAGFQEFLAVEDVAEREFFLPDFVNQLILDGKARVRVLATPESWFGVTYREDMPRARQRLSDLIEAGVYPRSLWRV
jgi:NDP-sugar pyrophosphorylase family protein